MEQPDVFDTVFDGVVAWEVLFHLPPEEQEAAIAGVSRVLKPGGRFLFTGGDQAGVAESEMDGVSFRYVSLGAERYRAVLREHGFEILGEHRDRWEDYVFQACSFNHSDISPSLESTTYGNKQAVIPCDCDESTKGDASPSLDQVYPSWHGPSDRSTLREFFSRHLATTRTHGTSILMQGGSGAAQTASPTEPLCAKEHPGRALYRNS